MLLLSVHYAGFFGGICLLYHENRLHGNCLSKAACSISSPDRLVADHDPRDHRLVAVLLTLVDAHVAGLQLCAGLQHVRFVIE